MNCNAKCQDGDLAISLVPFYSGPQGVPGQLDPVSLQRIADAEAAAEAAETSAAQANTNATNALNTANGLKTDLANGTDGAKGAAMVAYGGTSVANLLKTGFRVLNFVADLTTLNPDLFNNAFILSFDTKGDGGGGAYWFDESDTISTVIPGVILLGSKPGRWKLIYQKAVSILQCGAKRDGSANAATVVQAMVTGGLKDIYIPAGEYLWNTSVDVGNHCMIQGEHGTVLKAGANNLTFFLSSTTAYYSGFAQLHCTGNAKTNVVGWDMKNMRLQSRFDDIKVSFMEQGFVGRDGCFGLLLKGMTAEAVKYPVIFLSNNSGSHVLNPAFDNGTGVGGDGTGVGVTISGGGSNLGSMVSGGYIQGFARGIDDNGGGTVVDATYFENNLTADIWAYGDCFGPRYHRTQHWGNVGACAIKVTNSVPNGSILYPICGSGARTKLVDDPGKVAIRWVFADTDDDVINVPRGDITHMGRIGGSAPVDVSSLITIAGSTAAGTATYTTRDVKVVRGDNEVIVEGQLTWTGHTGTGAITIAGVPAKYTPAAFTPHRIGQVAASGFALPGDREYCHLAGSGTLISVISVVKATGVESLMPMVTAGTISFRLAYTP